MKRFFVPILGPIPELFLYAILSLLLWVSLAFSQSISSPEPQFSTLQDAPESGVLVGQGETLTLTENFSTGLLRIQGTLIVGDVTLTVRTIIIEEGGLLQVGTPASPVHAEIIIRDQPPSDVDQLYTGILVAGKIVMAGFPKTPYIRLLTAPVAGAILGDFPNDWQPSDRLVIPDTRQLPIDHPKRYAKFYRSQTEVFYSGQPLAFSHVGAGNDLTPHVANLTRSVVVRSENPAGYRGHIFITSKAEADLRYVEFRDLGRTTVALLDPILNHVGRYPLHFHHVYSGQVLVDGCVITGSGGPWKWGIVLHDTHYAQIRNNVVYNVAGSGFQTESGNESYNRIQGNFALKISGIGETKLLSATDPAVGRDGSGFWFRGPHNYVENNIAADVRFAGFYYSGYYLQGFLVPALPGVAPTVYKRFLPVLRFDSNESYSSQHGVWVAWLSGCCTTKGWPENRFTNTVIWNAWQSAVKNYHSGRIVYDGVIVRGTYRAKAFDGSPIETVGFGLDFYENVYNEYRNIDVEGMTIGFVMARKTQETGLEPPLLLQTVRLRNYINIKVPRGKSPTKFLLRDVTFEEAGPLDIFMDYYFDPGTSAIDLTVSGLGRIYFKEAGFPCTKEVPRIYGYVCPGGIL